jgi:predicted RNA binding protein YcfA (HicA-like mRNA interferase family)
MTVRKVIRLIESDGWFQIKAKGGHRQFKHPVKLGRVTVAGKLSVEIPPKTLKSIFRQAGLEAEQEQ